MRSTLLLMVLPLACAGTWSDPPLRIHLLQSELPVLDGAGATDEEEVLERIEAINEIFAPAGIRWQVESIGPVHAIHEDRIKRALRSDNAGIPSLARAMPAEALLSPDGWDLVVVANTAPFGFGGVFACDVGGKGGPAAAFVPEYATGGEQPQVLRKWAHELGHAAGLGHTPCTEEWSEHLMMSGKCEKAEPDRIAFSDAEIAEMERRLRLGHPSLCVDPD